MATGKQFGIKLLTMKDLNERFERSLALTEGEKRTKTFSIFNGYVYRSIEINAAWTGYRQAAVDLGMICEEPVTPIHPDKGFSP